MKSRVNYPEFTRGEARKAVADAVKKTSDLHVGTWFPVIQAESRAWADNYVAMREPVPFPVGQI